MSAMNAAPSIAADDRPRLKVHTKLNAAAIPQLAAFDPRTVRDMQIVAKVLPFRVNTYVIDNLIDWSNVPDDPLFRLVFPNRAMLSEEDFDRVAHAVARGASPEEEQAVVDAVRARLQPHPAGQISLNRPQFNGETVAGLQHKYRETVLFFPSEGQTCHSYCTFCFRWPQFVHDEALRIAMSDRQVLGSYLASHEQVSDLLVTGGDAFVMKARRLKHFLDQLAEPQFDHIKTVRFGTKAASFWPYRFVTDPDADELLDFLHWLGERGKHVAVMAHYNHWRELQTPIAQEAIARLRATGAVVRAQGPLMRGINDDPAVWARLWQRQVELGIVPYYMFVARDTGARRYFEVPLARAWNIYAEASRRVSGLARTARGPSMSAEPGKIEITGVAEIGGEKAFVLRFLQARDPALCHRPFFAKYDEDACWIDDLKPLSGDRFFFERPEGAQPPAEWTL